MERRQEFCKSFSVEKFKTQHCLDVSAIAAQAEGKEAS